MEQCCHTGSSVLVACTVHILCQITVFFQRLGSQVSLFRVTGFTFRYFLSSVGVTLWKTVAGDWYKQNYASACNNLT